MRKVLTKIDHILFPEIFANAGIESVVSPIRSTASQIIRFVRAMQNSLSSSNIETLHKLVSNRVEALEFLEMCIRDRRGGEGGRRGAARGHTVSDGGAGR